MGLSHSLYEKISVNPGIRKCTNCRYPNPQIAMNPINDQIDLVGMEKELKSLMVFSMAYDFYERATMVTLSDDRLGDIL
jgi:hypothetical protein